MSLPANLTGTARERCPDTHFGQFELAGHAVKNVLACQRAMSEEWHGAGLAGALGGVAVAPNLCESSRHSLPPEAMPAHLAKYNIPDDSLPGCTFPAQPPAILTLPLAFGLPGTVSPLRCSA